MKKKSNIFVCFVLLIGLLAAFTLTCFAGVVESENSNSVNVVPQHTLELFPGERARPMTRNTMESIPVANANELCIYFNLDVSELNETLAVLDSSNRVATKMRVNESAVVTIDDTGDITFVSNFPDMPKSQIIDEDAYVKEGAGAKSSFVETFIEHTQESLSSDYVLVYNAYIDNDYLQLTWQKQLQNGVMNPYQTVKALIDVDNETVISYVSYEREANAQTAAITSASAIHYAEQYVTQHLSDMNELVISGTDLAVIEANDFRQAAPNPLAGTICLAYVVSFDNGAYQIYIDAITGDMIGGNMVMADSAGVFGMTSMYYPYGKEGTDLALNGMNSLGYTNNTYLCSDAKSMRTSILNFWKGANSYAFYFRGHGSTTTIASLKEKENGTKEVFWRLETKDIPSTSPNWHFVFLDACHTAETTDWCNAFNATPTNRGFLGWSNIVYTNASYEFAKQFWPRVGTRPIRTAAVEAANLVSGAGTTPIRFYGDTAYYGTAW